MLVSFSISRGSLLAFLIFDMNTPVVKCYVKVCKGKEEGKKQLVV